MGLLHTVGCLPFFFKKKMSFKVYDQSPEKYLIIFGKIFTKYLKIFGKIFKRYLAKIGSFTSKREVLATI